MSNGICAISLEVVVLEMSTTGSTHINESLLEVDVENRTSSTGSQSL
jgi:hypothetical protein